MSGRSNHLATHCRYCHRLLAYEENGREYSRIIGVEVQGTYDGVLYWQCPFCDGKWPRFGKESNLYQKALDVIARERA